MAEQVQAALDQMVEPLLDLQNRGVFSRDEIRSIVDRRRQSEYALRRRGKLRKADFIGYIQAETQLEALRALRVQRITREERRANRGKTSQDDAKDSNTSGTSKIGDRHIVQLIHLLWTRTLRKFRDVSFFLEYAEFCRSQKSFAKLATVYAQALALHPKQTGLWIAAASHEFFQSSTPHTARILLQRGIRVNPTSPDLWLQSLVMELHLVQKLRGRRDVLRGAGRGGEEEEDKEVSEHKIARLLYDNAIQAIPDRVEFRLQCLDQCRLFPNTEDLQAYIHISMERDCSSRPEAWIARAMHEWERHRKLGENEKSSIGFLHSNGLGDDLNQRQEDNPQRKKARTLLHHEQEARDDVLKVIKQAVDTLSSHEMYLQGIRFLLSYMQELAEELEESDDSKEKLERSQRFLFQLFDQAKTLHFETSDLILEQVAFLALVESDQEASQCIQNFVENHPTKASIDVWRRYAAMSPDQAVDILEEAAKYISVEQEAHMVVLLELFGAKLAIPDEKSLPVLFQTILLLAPGFGEMKDVEDPVYGIKNISCACLQYLRYASKHHGLNEMRRIYQAVLFESSLGTLEGGDPSLINIFLEEAMKAEEEFGSSKETRCQLRRLCDIALQLFENTDEEEKYRRRKENILYGRLRTPSDLSIHGLPCSVGTNMVQIFDVDAPDFSAEAFEVAYSKFRVVKIRHAYNMKEQRSFSWKNIGPIFDNLDASDKESWCLETNEGEPCSPESFLQSKLDTSRAYCSFLIQQDEDAYKSAMDLLPISELSWTNWSYEPALWMFFGRNRKGNDPLEGRPEHTDAILHDGTWHYQLSGGKEWYLRPTKELLKHMDGHLTKAERRLWSESSRVCVACEEGSILVINTKLWFHRTVIPSQKQPSVSYARDFRFDLNAACIRDSKGMTNVDGLYATSDIEEGTIIFTENDMPECELHRSSTDPNCEVVALDDGSSAVVSMKAITAGEFFSVLDSESEEEGEVDPPGST